MTPPMADQAAPLEPEFSVFDLRNALGMFATGVAIVTATCNGQRIAATISSFNSVSLEPPIVMFSIARNSKAFSAWNSIDQFAINVLNNSQRDLSSRFARSLANKWDGVASVRGHVTDTHLLHGALAWIECETFCRYDGGDHVIILGRVLTFSRDESRNAAPLIFFGGAYRSLARQDSQEMRPDEAVWIYGW